MGSCCMSSSCDDLALISKSNVALKDYLRLCLFFLCKDFEEKEGIQKRFWWIHIGEILVMTNDRIINSLEWYYRMSSKTRLVHGHEECVCELRRTFINPTTFPFIHVLDVCLRKMTLHTRRAPNNCGASGRASRTEIKQVLSHNPCLLKISLFRRGWWILGSCILSSGCGGNCLISVELWERDCT